MNAASPDLAVHSAAAEMVALATTVRPDWDADIVAGLLQRAAAEGMTWKQVLVSLPRLMADPQAGPHDLLKAVESPLKRQAGSGPTPEWQEARQRLAQMRATS